MAVLYEKPRSIVDCEYVWQRTELWIDFPWSIEPPVTPAERPEHLAGLRVPSELLLREDRLAVRDHVELAAFALVDRRFVPVHVARPRGSGPIVVAASDRAVVELDLHGSTFDVPGRAGAAALQPPSPSASSAGRATRASVRGGVFGLDCRGPREIQVRLFPLTALRSRPWSASTSSRRPRRFGADARRLTYRSAGRTDWAARRAPAELPSGQPMICRRLALDSLLERRLEPGCAARCPNTTFPLCT